MLKKKLVIQIIKQIQIVHQRKIIKRNKMRKKRLDTINHQHHLKIFGL